MSNEQYVFTLKQRRLLYFVSGLLWLIGIAILYYFDGLSILSFLLLSIVLLGCGSYTLEIKWWVNIGVIIVGIIWIGLSYLEHIDPIGIEDVKEWWIGGTIAILVGIYWLSQRTLTRL
jgi:hypothetical protein